MKNVESCNIPKKNGKFKELDESDKSDKPE